MCRRRSSIRRDKRSSALVITLAILVLISGLLIVFLNQSTLNRAISFSSSGQYRSDLLAHTAVETIVGDLRSEIVAGSTTYKTSGNSNIYLPTTNFTAVPSRVGNQNFTNLVKQSVAGLSFWSGQYYNTGITSPVRSAANNNTLSPSFNDRYIKVSQWNEPGLLGDPGTGTTAQVPTVYTPPDWVLITRQGAVINANTLPAVAPGLGSLSDRSASNPNYVIGRYAYAIYNEGGLLDVNVAGVPSTLSGATFTTRRGLLPQVDLANLLSNPSINDITSAAADANALVSWRNTVTASSANSYTNYVMSSTNGFTSVATGDQAFVSRKDLINYIKNNSAIPTAALTFLGTFTRDSDGPSYYPNPNRPKVSSTQDDITNPQILAIRVQNGFPRPDGTTAVLGEPLLKHRFPLSRLALFQNPTSNANAIKTYFSMQQRSDGLWDYVDPDTGVVATALPAIKMLADVASTNPGREPTFWELLQAGILTGSLGTDGAGPLGYYTSQNQSTTRQILAIGLSIIGQYVTDDQNPLVLNLGGLPTYPPTAAKALNSPVAGTANLPYIMTIAHNFFRDNVTTVSSTQAYLDGYLMFLLWNPHRNSSNATPGTFQITFNGVVQTRLGTSTTATYSNPPFGFFGDALQFSTTKSRTFSQIDVIRPSDVNAGASSPYALFPYSNSVKPSSPLEVGMLMGQVTTNNTGPVSGSMDIVYDQPVTMALEKQVGSNWIPYQIIPFYNADYGYAWSASMDEVSAEMNAGKFDASSATPPMALANFHSDPRTMRFGMGFDVISVTGFNAMLDNAFRLIDSSQNAISSFAANENTNSLSSIFPTPGNLTLADYAYNPTDKSVPYYTDRDGVVRKGDSNPASTTIQGADSPYSYTTTSPSDARPIVLNRPFTSVAEMGYAFRDDPWRSLNFSSPDSADGGLLDLFCLTENDNALRAGVLDVNGASTEVLASMLMNAYRDPSATDGSPLTLAQATTLAQAIRTQLGPPSNPLLVLQNPADLPTLIGKIAASLPDTFKYKREAVTRSFADVINTRTLNLMIDVVAQSGRYSSTARSLNDFVVEAEKRYWVHIALDRFTGEILDIRFESVSD